jgi:hypothetical protein
MTFKDYAHTGEIWAIVANACRIYQFDPISK